MQVERKRLCTACGSESAPDASFCWRCLTPFAEVPPPPPIGIGHPALQARSMPASTPSPASTTRRGSTRLLGGLVSIVAALAGYLGVQHLLGPDRSLPDSLAGATRLADATSRAFERFTAEEAQRYGIDAEGGVYGSGAQPRFFVILVDAAAIETTDQLFEALLAGFAQAGASVDGSRASSGERGDSDYRCVAAAAAGEHAVACMWRDADDVGIVFEAPGSMRGTRRLLWTVRDAVVT
ncbi:MAG TPA: hypothetical protein VFQ40_04740 [Actinomycetota bacterium]|nr:hypothetical protein [Actinomycetota bacterium]